MAKEIIKISFHEAGEKGVGIGYKNYGDQGLKDTTSKECKNIPHADFINAMQDFRWHLKFLCEFSEANNFDKFPEREQESPFRVCGITITGSEEKAGIMITGYKTLSTGKGYSFNTPNLRFTEESCPFQEELEDHLRALKSHAQEYLAGKYGVKQGELFEKQDGEPAPSN